MPCHRTGYDKHSIRGGCYGLQQHRHQQAADGACLVEREEGWASSAAKAVTPHPVLPSSPPGLHKKGFGEGWNTSSNVKIWISCFFNLLLLLACLAVVYVTVPKYSNIFHINIQTKCSLCLGTEWYVLPQPLLVQQTDLRQVRQMRQTDTCTLT